MNKLLEPNIDVMLIFWGFRKDEELPSQLLTPAMIVHKTRDILQ